MNPEDDFLLVLTESGLRQQMLKAIDNYLNWQPTDGRMRSSAREEVVDEIISDLLIHGKYAGTIG